MKLAVVTNATGIDNEHEIIERMFRHGLRYLHVRKPKYSKEKFIEYLEGFSSKYRDRIIIHSHHTLALTMGLKGIHLTEKHREKTLDVWKKFRLFRLMRPSLYISTSFHKLSDLKEDGDRYNYVFFSPVFESISKEDYKPSYTLGAIFNALNNNVDVKVMALGGVSADKIDICHENLFTGVALSGYIWEADDPVKNFDDAKEVCRQYKVK